MAITITTQPSTPIAANGYALFAVSSNNVGSNQFQYVMDVISGSTRVARIRQYPNPEGVAIFDTSRIMSDYISPNPGIFYSTTNQMAVNDGSVQQFIVKFGEEYGVSPSSSVTLYNGNDQIGDPAVTGSVSTYNAFLGSVPYNATYTQQFDGDATGLVDSFNFRDVYEDPIALTYGSRNAADTYDAQHVGRFDWGITAFWTPTWNPTQGNLLGRNDATGNITFNESFTGGFNGELNYAPSGLLNALEMGASVEDVNNTDRLTIFLTNGSNFVFREFRVDDTVCHSIDGSGIAQGLDVNPNLNFIFRNSFGFWDQFSTRKPVKATSNIERKITSQPFAPWSSADAAYPINNNDGITLGGDKAYSITENQEFRVNLGYLGMADARVALDLIRSKEIYTQYVFQNIGTNNLAYGFKPIIITNTSVEELTDKYRQKLFQIEINYRYAIRNRSY